MQIAQVGGPTSERGDDHESAVTVLALGFGVGRGLSCMSSSTSMSEGGDSGAPFDVVYFSAGKASVRRIIAGLEPAANIRLQSVGPDRVRALLSTKSVGVALPGAPLFIRRCSPLDSY